MFYSLYPSVLPEYAGLDCAGKTDTDYYVTEEDIKPLAHYRSRYLRMRRVNTLSRVDVLFTDCTFMK